MKAPPINLSVAVAVGFIALFGLAVETGIVMVIYLNDAMQPSCCIASFK